MRILMLTSSYVDRSLGGLENHILFLGEALMRRGHEVLVVRCSRESGDAQPPPVPPFTHIAPAPTVRALQRFGRRYMPGHLIPQYWGRLVSNAALPDYKTLVDEFRPEVVHHHDFIENWKLARAMSRRAKAPLVWTNHLGETLILNRSGTGRQALRLLTREFALALAPSEELLAASGSARRRVYCPNGVDTDRFAPLSASAKLIAREKSGLIDEFVVVVPRRWAPTKGVLYLAQALAGVELRNLRVIFVGAKSQGYEDYADDVSRVLATWKIPFQVETSIPPLEMPSLYQLADLVVIPSVLEATSLAALEAMASGCIVLATRVGGLPELITHGQSGFLCDPRSPDSLLAGIRAAIRLSGDQRIALGTAARATVVDQYSWGKIAGRVETEYRRAITNAKSDAY